MTTSSQRYLFVLLQAADGTTDLAQQLPKALQQAVVQQIFEDNLTPQLLSVLARCAADVQQAQEQQLAQQQGELAQQQEQIAQQQEEIAWMRQELTGVQDALVALQQQLQGHAEPSNP